MIVDIHTHTYPAAISAKVINKLARQTDLFNYTDGTVDALSASQLSAGIDYSILLPVVTKPSQADSINEIAVLTNRQTSESHLLSFGGIHPDNTDFKEILDYLYKNKVKGIKLHPMFQGVQIDDKRYLNIIDYACSHGLLVLIHGGGDINFPDLENAAPKYIRNMMHELGHPGGIIIAHMGGWHCWQEAMDELNGLDLYLDTSSTLTPTLTYEGKELSGMFRSPLSDSFFREMVDCFGANRILFGSDSPWGGQKQSLNALNRVGLDENELRLIRGQNAAHLLNLN